MLSAEFACYLITQNDNRKMKQLVSYGSKYDNKVSGHEKARFESRLLFFHLVTFILDEEALLSTTQQR
jgi:hypothetical protein